ncbi:MAG TPA: hypothetical protein VFV47_04255 [Hyphomicrobiaceae bacterium]|nr:hypothetical protein [Hyphomicrobiaceae bacterium]
MAILTGTAAADTQLGTAFDDGFYASAGDDKIWGGTGGFDRLFLTGKMSEYAVQDNGNGSYTLTHYRVGGDGVDIVRDIDSFIFADRIVSLTELLQQAFNRVSGTSGHDTLLGTGKNDRLEGGAGDDSIWGGTAGSDLAVYSGKVSDYKIWANGNGSYTIMDLRGIDGVDIVRDVESFQFANETIDLDSLMALMPKESMGTDGDDNQIGSSGNDRFYSSGGNDRIWGTGQGDDLVIYSGNFADYAILDNRDGSYTVIDTRTGSADGTDKVRDIGTFQFADRVATLREFLVAHPTGFILDGQGSAGDDVIHGSAGDDVLRGNGGRDRIWGGKGGTDTVVFTGTLADYIVTDNANGAFTVKDTRSSGADGIAVVRDVEVFQFADGSVSHTDLMAASTLATATRMLGTAAADTMSGAHTMGLFDAHTNDDIIGNSGDDLIRGGPGNDLILGDGEVQAAGVTSIAIAAGASTLPRFEQGAGYYQVVQGQLLRIDPLTGANEPIGEDHQNYDAVGLNPLDGYAYGIGHSGPWTGHLLRIGSNGAVETLGAGYQPTKAGGFASDGTLYLRTGTKELTLVNVATGTTSTMQFGGENPPPVNDIVFLPNGQAGAFYGITVNGILAAYDLATATISTASIAGALVSGGAYGSGWAGADGGLYFSHDRTGHIYGISGIENMKPSASLIAVGVKTNSSDGFSSGPVSAESSDEGGSDTLLGGAGNDTLVGGSGRDFLDGGLGADRLEGGTGCDTADYSRAAEGVHADLGSGGVSGEAAGDTYLEVENLLGSAYADILIGDGQDNEITGGAGNDLLRGGFGDDTLRGQAGADSIDGGDGHDTATYYDSVEGIAVDLALGQGWGGDAEGDILVGVEAIQGSNSGADTLLGSAGTDNLYGFGGNDLLDGRGGADFIFGGDGSDMIYGGDGADFLVGQNGADLINGGNGADNVQGGEGDDTLIGEAGDDRLWGAAGNDRLIGGQGLDALRGGAGADVFVLTSGTGNDRVLDFEAGVDQLDFTVLDTVSGLEDLAISRVHGALFQISYLDGGEINTIEVQIVSGNSLSATDFLF